VHALAQRVDEREERAAIDEQEVIVRAPSRASANTLGSGMRPRATMSRNGTASAGIMSSR
jgi:hypothetical protein